MTPQEIVSKWIGFGLFDDEPIVTEAEAAIVAGLKADIQQAITAAVEEDRRTRPHTFVGRTDRDCELCSEPDRDEIHIANHEMLRNRLKLAVEEERKRAAQIIHEVYSAWVEGDYSPGEAFESAREKILYRSTADSAEPMEK